MARSSVLAAATVSVQGVWLLAAGAAVRGLDVPALLARHGLSDAPSADVDARVPASAVLELWGAIVTATSAIDAIRVALIADVIVCDLTSAEHANGEFLERLRHMHVRQGRRVPAIALVDRGLRGARERAPGFQRYLAKPVDGDQLRATVIDLARE